MRKGGWGEREHLRLALISYVAKGRSDEGSARSYWRTALGAAVGDATKLRELGKLAAAWDWSAEEMGALAKVFEIDPSNREAFDELMSHNRSEGRTAELVSVLNAYVSANPTDR